MPIGSCNSWSALKVYQKQIKIEIDTTGLTKR